MSYQPIEAMTLNDVVHELNSGANRNSGVKEWKD